MNRCTSDEILHAHVSRQPLEPYWISRPSVKSQGRMVFLRCHMCMMLRLPVDST